MSIQKTKKFRQSGILRHGPSFVTYVMLGTSIFLVYGFVSDMVQQKIFRPEATVAAIIMLGLFIFMAIMSSCFFPSWEISENKFQIQSLFFKTDWLNWHEIIAIRQLPRGIHAIRIDRLPWPYIVQGFSYGLGGRTFLLSQKIENYDLLFEILSKQRPDLFA